MTINKFSKIKPSELTSQTQEILRNLSLEFNSDFVVKNIPRLHKDNSFNRRYSSVLDTFHDIKSVSDRLTNNIPASIEMERKIRESKAIDQELCKNAEQIWAQNKSDLRTLYVNSKIFLDHFTNLLRFIFNWRGIGDKSVTNFYNSLEEYSGNDQEVLDFKKNCLKKLKAVDVFITNYRDKKIMHNQSKHKEETEWFVNDMAGGIRFVGGGRPSITPQEILYIVREYVDVSNKYCSDWLRKKMVS